MVVVLVFLSPNGFLYSFIRVLSGNMHTMAKLFVPSLFVIVSSYHRFSSISQNFTKPITGNDIVWKCC